MANCTYLCTSSQRVIYPSSSEPGYDSKQQTIAMDVWAIPLTWLMLFRESDISENHVPAEHGSTTLLRAPLVAIDVALTRLPKSLASLSSVLPQQRSLQPHADMLASAIMSADRQFVTIEVLELEYGISLEHFWPVFRHCLRGFDDPSCWISDPSPSLLRSIFRRPTRLSWQDSLSTITTLRFDIPFPPADLLHAKGIQTDDDLWNSSRLFGEALYRPVPWEPTRP